MGERTSYAAGTFCWTDLGTTDVEAAKIFYGGLFGWQPEDVPAGEGVTYTTFRLDGKTVAATYAQGAPELEQGLSPHWTSYISVDDAAATVAKARDLGATVITDAFDVMEHGRMALVQDAIGAIVALWQPKAHIGAERVNEPGCLSWNELATRDGDAAGAFYEQLFGWEISRLEGPAPYWIVNNQGGGAGAGIREMGAGEDEVPPYWLVYFAVSDIDVAARTVGELGGTVLVPPQVLPMGRFAAAHDPAGAVFALYEGQLDP